MSVNIKQKIINICNAHSWDITCIETDKDHVHFIICYAATDRVCDIIKFIKQETTYYLWQKYSDLLSR